VTRILGSDLPPYHLTIDEITQALSLGVRKLRRPMGNSKIAVGSSRSVADWRGSASGLLTDFASQIVPRLMAPR
jgi:hypothetical protein